MKYVIFAGALSVAIAAGVGPARAVSPEDFRILTTGSLYQVCSAPTDSELFDEARQACYGFIYGAGLFYYEVVKAGKAKSVVCPSGELTRESVREAFVSWAVDHPDAMDQSPIEGLMRAAMARWPCPT